MRLWTLHPRYLDTKGLVAAWREALLAQKVLAGKTRGYRNHPQLLRFRMASQPNKAIGAYLSGLAKEAAHRGYNFDISKIEYPQWRGHISETQGQLKYEWSHLKAKLALRAPETFRALSRIQQPQAHPLFRLKPGKVREWENTQSHASTKK